MTDSNAAIKPIPLTGKSRWKHIEAHIPISREKFRRLSLEGRAPQREELSIRCVFYDNAEVLRWIADPVGYRVKQKR